MRQLRSQCCLVSHKERKECGFLDCCLFVKPRPKKPKIIKKPKESHAHHKKSNSIEITRQNSELSPLLDCQISNNLPEDPLFLKRNETSCTLYSEKAMQISQTSMKNELSEYLSQIEEHFKILEITHPSQSIYFSELFTPFQHLRLLNMISYFSHISKFSIETQFMAYDIFHRVNSIIVFSNINPSLRAATSLFIAAKYHQKCFPRSQYFVKFDQSSPIQSKSIISLEGLILQQFNFDLSFIQHVHYLGLETLKLGLTQMESNEVVNLLRKAVYSAELWPYNRKQLVDNFIRVVLDQRAENLQDKMSSSPSKLKMKMFLGQL